MRFGNVSFSALFAALALLVGCAAQPSEVSVPASDYPRAFNAARDALYGYGFTLDRVDARAGVLTTLASPSAGFFTPWNRQESTLGQEWEDSIHNQQRRVEIVFTPTPAGAELQTNQALPFSDDLIESPRDTDARVRVVIERIYQFGWRPNTKSTYLASLTEDTKSAEGSRLEVEYADDPHLAGRIAQDIRSRMTRSAPTPEAVPPAPAETTPVQNSQPAAAESGGTGTQTVTPDR